MLIYDDAPPQTTTLLLTPAHSTTLLLTLTSPSLTPPPHSSSLLLTPPHSSFSIINPVLTSILLKTVLFFIRWIIDDKFSSAIIWFNGLPSPSRSRPTCLKPVFHSRIFSREATFFLCRYHLLRQQDVAKWIPTKEKGRRFARKNSLVENWLNLS